MDKNKIKYFLLGMLVIIFIFIIISATSDNNQNQTGKYQVFQIPGAVTIIDTQTGIAKAFDVQSNKVFKMDYNNESLEISKVNK